MKSSGTVSDQFAEGAKEDHGNKFAESTFSSSRSKEKTMNTIIYLVGLVVVIGFILSLLGLV